MQIGAAPADGKAMPSLFRAFISGEAILTGIAREGFACTLKSSDRKKLSVLVSCGFPLRNRKDR